MQLSNEELRKLQLIQLTILKEVHKICEKNNIKYFLSDGTLIGAVRHKGFIPWDDDIDIGMLRDEYERFCSVCRTDLSDGYFLQTMETDPDYAWPFAKVMLKNTVWIEENSKNSNKYSSIYIDIFPYDVITKSKIKQFFQKKCYILLRCTFAKRRDYILTKNRKNRLIDFLSYFLFFIPDDNLRIMVNNIVRKYNYLSKDENCIVTKFVGNYYKNQNPKASFSKVIVAEFEHFSFYIPEAYDSILKNLYGDYMALPPEEKRKSNHDIYYYKF
jgi:lipopolysaccharide cholinephosphotransferase